MGQNQGYTRDPDILATQRLLLEIARALVDDPESVQVQATTEGSTATLRLQVADSDVGKIIGKRRTNRPVYTHHPDGHLRQEAQTNCIGHSSSTDRLFCLALSLASNLEFAGQIPGMKV